MNIYNQLIRGVTDKIKEVESIVSDKLSCDNYKVVVSYSDSNIWVFEVASELSLKLKYDRISGSIYGTNHVSAFKISTCDLLEMLNNRLTIGE